MQGAKVFSEINSHDSDKTIRHLFESRTFMIVMVSVIPSFIPVESLGSCTQMLNYLLEETNWQCEATWLYACSHRIRSGLKFHAIFIRKKARPIGTSKQCRLESRVLRLPNMHIALILV